MAFNKNYFVTSRDNLTEKYYFDFSGNVEDKNSFGCLWLTTKEEIENIDENNIKNYFKESPIIPISKIRDFLKEYKEAKMTEDTLYFERRTEEEIKEIKELLNGLYD